MVLRLFKMFRLLSALFWFCLGGVAGSLAVIYIPNFREKVVVAFKESSKRALAFVENNISTVLPKGEDKKK